MTEESEFARETHVEPVGHGSFRADLRPGWVVGGGVSGGFLLATIGRAISEIVPDKPDPIAISAYFLSATTPGPATVTARVLRGGGSVATDSGLAAFAPQPTNSAGQSK